jgi:hypothetical protein
VTALEEQLRSALARAAEAAAAAGGELAEKVSPLLQELAGLHLERTVVPRADWLFRTASFHVHRLRAHGAVDEGLGDALEGGYQALLGLFPRPSIEHDARAPIAGFRPTASRGEPQRRPWLALDVEAAWSPPPGTVPTSPPPAPAPEGTGPVVGGPSSPSPEDLGLADPTPRVIVLEDRGQPVAIAEGERQLVADCMDALASRSRASGAVPVAELDAHEAIMLRELDAIAVVRDAPAAVVQWWRANLENPHAARASIWALARFDGGGSLELCARGLEALPAGADDHARWAAAALRASGHPELARLVSALHRSHHPAARAVAVEVAAELDGDLDRWRDALSDPSPLVLAAAARGAEWLGADPIALVPPLRALAGSPDRWVAWPAARASCLLGDRDVYARLSVEEGSAALSPQQIVEVFVMCGALGDADALMRHVGRTKPDGALLDALARFGHAGCAPYLLHCLTDEDLSGDADVALRTLFGDVVDDEATRADWEQAIARVDCDPDARLRRGQTASPRVLVEECRSGHLSPAALGARLDELRARWSYPIAPTVYGWHVQWAAPLEAWLEQGSRRQSPRPA